MGRARKIQQDDILDAAERAVVRLGAAGLSIDAVAQEAGVSKSSVVYDHKSKSALLVALINRQIKIERERVREALSENADAPHPELFARIAVAKRIPLDKEKAVALAISASMVGERQLVGEMRRWTDEDLGAMSEGDQPEAALMAYLALTGLSCIELFDFHTWKPTERDRILEGIRSIYTAQSNCHQAR